MTDRTPGPAWSTLWAKTSDDAGSVFHPLAYHMLDVALAAEALWSLALTDHLRDQLASAFGVSEAECARLIALLCAQHDLGKASSFQLRAPALWEQVQEIGENPTPDGLRHLHGSMTFRLLPDLVKAGATGWTAGPRVARTLAQIVGGHHGVFPGMCAVGPGVDARGGDAWDAARAELLRALSSMLAPDAPLVELRPRQIEDAILAPLVGGLACVADWLASDAGHFLPSSHVAVEDYRRIAEAQVEAALKAAGWLPSPRYARPAPFDRIFRGSDGIAFVPNPMQQVVAAAADGAATPYLMVIEAAMGDGKTEAALYAVDRALTTGQARGFYVALPTQATGDAMFARVVDDYLRPRGHGGHDIQLVHGAAFLSERFSEIRVSGVALDANDPGDRITAQMWFAPRKRALLSPMGVGTIDQVLLGVLQTRHWFVRLFGLAGKVVVFDEVHAYDLYTGRLLKAVLSWLRRLGCTVIVLSATLPQTRRNELLEAWGTTDDPACDTANTFYPRVTVVPAGGAATVSQVQDDSPDTHVELARCTLDHDALVACVRYGLPDGGCGAVICNTIANAQGLSRHLADALGPDGWDVRLLHARTPAMWRKADEAAAIASFGRHGTRPVRSLLVGTQVIEQSLDIDFDWMASEMAPADLLLQRMGRLWRHQRTTRPAPHPRFVLLCDQGDDGMPAFPVGTARVYERYVLLRSVLALEPGSLAALDAVDARGWLALPRAIAPIVRAVYDDPEPADAGRVWRSALEDSRDKCRRREEHDGLRAARIVVPAPDLGLAEVLNPGQSLSSSEARLYDDDDPKVHPDVRAATRLGLPGVSVVCTGTSLEGLQLAPDARSAPDGAAMRELLGWSVSIRHPGLFRELVHTDVPGMWEASPHLRHHRVLHFEDGRTIVGDCTLTISRSAGIAIEKGKGQLRS